MARLRRLPITFRLGLLLSLLFGPAAAAADVVGANGAETEAAATAEAGSADMAAARALIPALLDVTVNGQAGDEPVRVPPRPRRQDLYFRGLPQDLADPRAGDGAGPGRGRGLLSRPRRCPRCV